MKFSLKTSIFGTIAGIAGTVAAQVTDPQIKLWATQIAIAAGVIGAWFARDHSVSDEAAGVAPSQAKAMTVPLPLPNNQQGKAASRLGLALLGALVGASLLGCKTATLQPGGAYAPNQVATNSLGVAVTNSLPANNVLYQADSAFWAAYSATDAILTLEQQNRAALFKLDPNIKHTLDGIRPNATLAVRSYAAARLTYVTTPTSANAGALQSAIADIQTALNIATSVQTEINKAQTLTQ